MKRASDLKILLVDDDRAVLDALELLFEADYMIARAVSGQEAMDIVSRDNNIAVVVMDIKMPGMDGIEASRVIRANNTDLPIIFHTGFPGVYTEDDIDEKERPFDYVQKGGSVSKLTRAVRNAIEAYRFRKGLPMTAFDSVETFGMIGKSRQIQDVFRIILRVAPTNMKVMLLGETGTGKELAAKAIHKLSGRKTERLVIFNCNHKAPDLVESELFGHGKGSFTGATDDRIGLFEYADKGTMFLDEIGDLDLTTQAKILRVLETGEFQTIGRTSELKSTDVRLICATHHNLKQMVEEGRFREDLYYRLKGVELVLPPLRKRKEDIPLFVSRYIDKITVEDNQHPRFFDASAMDILLQHDWPGNVRELLDTLEAIVVLSDSDLIVASDVQKILNQQESIEYDSDSLSGRTIEFRRNCIISALHECDNNINAAARNLKLDPANLRKLIKNYNVQIG